MDRTIHGIYVIDREGKIVWLNSVSQLIDGVDRNEIIGQKDEKIWGNLEFNIDISSSTIRHVMKSGKASEEELFTFTDASHKNVPMFL
ncbi:MAG: PAS domain-containing protein, partial [Bacillota bacterium]|nr:PAS domain-containing protein [Bacillota bacterium]